MKLLSLLLFMGSFLAGNAQTPVVRGKVLNAKGEGIPYATLLSMTDAKVGAIANEAGAFALTVGTLAVGQKMIVSALGYADTTFTLKKDAPAQPLIIRLRERPVVLPEITVRKSSGKTFLFGNPQGEMLKHSPTDYYFVKASQSGAGVGTVFSTQKRKGTIETISVFISESRPSNYVLTVFSLDEIGTDYKLYPKHQLIPLISRPISFTASKTGWIDIENLAIMVPAKYLAVLVTKVNEASDAGSTLPQTSYEYRIGRQFSKGGAARHIYLFGDRYAVLAKNDDISAIYVTCRE
ncbi:carboxypeptidase-like regulatory domain-containing protein [Runella slithyformis]|uniref:Carboxypeptidase-like regulatory domain-containing protein n=1 Tax=Runella slithyformis (strain ATCC 29530 / DSM 19594 / LMG 11500 / NCIMB 11436 / LSU 4) TaxID=761193 RepID=A0A7U3ZLX8_RUNSL|nr:carboxypeptidase-like regulatory domain-containing protein [Runella slithyformis]AEI49647.1 hypothetical protein Runsl_3272 [Runella slithyformis DSM 19594]